MTALVALFNWLSGQWFGQAVTAAIGWFQKRQQQQADANQAEQQAEQQHQTDGAQSVADQTSSDAQNAALDQLERQLDNPVEITVNQTKTEATK